MGRAILHPFCAQVTFEGKSPFIMSGPTFYFEDPKPSLVECEAFAVQAVKDLWHRLMPDEYLPPKLVGILWGQILFHPASES